MASCWRLVVGHLPWLQLLWLGWHHMARWLLMFCLPLLLSWHLLAHRLRGLIAGAGSMPRVQVLCWVCRLHGIPGLCWSRHCRCLMP